MSRRWARSSPADESLGTPFGMSQNMQHRMQRTLLGVIVCNVHVTGRGQICLYLECNQR